MSFSLRAKAIIFLTLLVLLAFLGLWFLTPPVRVVQEPAVERNRFVFVEPTGTAVLADSPPASEAGAPPFSGESSAISASGGAGPTLRLSPGPARVLLDQTGDTTVEIDNASELYGVELRLTFNPRLLEVVDAAPDTPGIQVVPGSVLNETPFFVVKNEVTNGAITFVAARQAPAPAFSGSGPLVHITWRGLALGQTPFTFDGAKLANAEGQALPLTAENTQLAVVPDIVTVQGQVDIQGRSQPVGFMLQVAGQPVHPGPDGRFIASVAGLAGETSLTISAPGCLSVQVTHIAANDSNIIDLGQITMLGGELTGDDRIDETDVSFISSRFGSYDARADLNGDGLVDILDLTPMMVNYGRQGPVQVMLGAEPATVEPQAEPEGSLFQPPSTHLLATAYSGHFVREWMQLLYDRVQADKLSPPAASRVYAYGGVTLYEAVVPGMPGYRSLEWQLNGLSNLPKPGEGDYHWPAVAASAMSGVTKALFTSPESQAAFDALRDRQLAELQEAGLPAGGLDPSIAHGQRLGEALVNWLEADHYRDIQARSFTPPIGPEHWTAVGDQQLLEPYWGELRPFVMPSADVCDPPAPETFSTDPTSTFYAQARQVYEVSQTLTEEQKLIASFWADNPGQTGTPPGHWVSIANQLIDQQQLNLGEAAHAHALLGIGLADSFISCWHVKYDVFLLRPASYIQQHIEPGWQSLIPTPPFPEYTSGHSVASAAAAEILTGIFGPISFVDSTYVSQGLPAFTYDSFTSAAEEAAISRLYGGIHYPMTIENGLAQGHCVGRMVLERTLTR